MESDNTAQLIDSRLAARIEQLNARRVSDKSTAAVGDADIDEALEARLRDLATRRDSVRKGTVGSSARSRRRHPAKAARIAALSLSLATTGGLTAAFAAAGASPQPNSAAPVGVVAASPATTQPQIPATSSAASEPSTTTAPVTPAPAAPTAVNGDVFSNRWGDVQVQAIFAPDGSIENVLVLQAPNGDRRSLQISNYAIPILNGEALQAQSAQVDTVSGATYTSSSYERSLQSAIDAARTAGITQI